MLRMIAIKVGTVDHRMSGIRWAKTMTRALPHRILIPDLYRTCRWQAFDPRYWRGVHEEARRLQIVHGMTSFSVTACRDGVIITDISRGRGRPNIGTTGDAKQAWERKYSVDLSSDACCCVGKKSAKVVQPEAGRNKGGAYNRKRGVCFGREHEEEAQDRLCAGKRRIPASVDGYVEQV